MRRAVLMAAGVLLAGSTVAFGASAYGSSTSGLTVKIQGQDIFHANDSLTSTFRFPDTIRVKQGERVTFLNPTVEGHTITMVRQADLPNSFAAVQNCNVCNAVDAIYFPNPSAANPAGFQIDSGKLTDDDTEADADAVDPVVPPGVTPPAPILVQDFNSSAHSNPNGSVTVGDSTIIGVGPGKNQRTIQVTAVPGTYHYFCTFHGWMQGTIIVTS